MSCSACSNGLEKYLKNQKGITNASVNLVMGTALVEYNEQLKIEDIEKYIQEAGYESLGIYNEISSEDIDKRDKTKIIIFAILALLIMYVSMGHMLKLPEIPFLKIHQYPQNYALFLLLLTIPFLIYAKDILKSGYKNLIYKNPNMDTLVSIGVLSSFMYSLYGTIQVVLGNFNFVNNLYFESTSIIIFFIKLGRYIDKNSKNKTKEAIKQLVQITPPMAIIKKDGKELEITIDEINRGDILIAKPGDKIAVDGTIISGTTHLDESFITGESKPVKKGEGSKVIAGSINYSGYIEYEAEKIGKDSTISEIVKLVVEATNTKAPIALFADKVSGYFVPIIIVVALLTFISYLLLGLPFDESINAFISVLVVSCPCALGLATPLAIVISEGICANHGILVKSSEVLENVHKVDTVVFDKTGTLTMGNLSISKVYNFSNISNEELISIAASVESKVTHPIAEAIVRYAKDQKINIQKVTEFENISGYGVKGKVKNQTICLGNRAFMEQQKIVNNFIDKEEELTVLGNSIVYVAQDYQIIGLIGVKDVLRDNVENVIKELNSRKIETIMLTGDNEKTANLVAKNIAIHKVIANVLPKEKANVIKSLKSKKKTVMMVGDGINDAPSLAIADIGVSISGASDIANDSADIILMNDNLSKILKVIDISRLTIRNIKQNLFWAFFYNILMIPIAIGFLKPIGISLNPMIAGIAMTISSLTVVFNALRLKRMKLGDDQK